MYSRILIVYSYAYTCIYKCISNNNYIGNSIPTNVDINLNYQ